jgi:hypothetical protein
MDSSVLVTTRALVHNVLGASMRCEQHAVVSNSRHLDLYVSSLTALQYAELKMVSQVEKANCVLRFHGVKSVINVKRSFRTAFGKEPP